LDNPRKIVKILKREYSLSELEDRLGITPDDLEEGYLYMVEERMEEIIEMLREDLWL